jgi:hypothetical protein
MQSAYDIRISTPTSPNKRRRCETDSSDQHVVRSALAENPLNEYQERDDDASSYLYVRAMS